MEKFVFECEFDEWASRAKDIQSKSIPAIISKNQNIFSSLQFIDEEISAHQNITTYCYKYDGVSIAWLCVYFLSPRTIRVRGLIVSQEYRRTGIMTQFLKVIFDKYQDLADRVISFSTSSAIEFHHKVGFQQSPDFAPRPIEIYNSSTGTYEFDLSETITLFYYNLKN